MTARPIAACLWFDDQAEEAARFYAEVFPGGRLGAVARFPQDNPPGKPAGSVLTVEFEAGGQRFTALNGGPQFVINPTISFFVLTESVERTERLFSALAEGGTVRMPLDTYPWSERYGWIEDRFGVSWQVMPGRPGSAGVTIFPCLMFTGPHHGQAEDAMQAYVRIFPDSRIEQTERYAAGEGPVDTIKHGRFVVAGHPMVAMDSHIEHGFTFNEAVSLMVMCKDQSEIDRYWAALADGGEPSQCGWLKDRFGVSWQVVPDAVAKWMASDDTVARDRAFRALLTMKKLDIAALQKAFEGAA